MPLAVEPTKACKDDAMPRRSGYKSSTSSVTTGTISAHPKANRAIGNMAHEACGTHTKLAATFTTDTSNITEKP